MFYNMKIESYSANIKSFIKSVKLTEKKIKHKLYQLVL